MQGDGIQIPFCHDDPALGALFCDVQGEEVFPFVENRSFGRVQVFWFAVIHDAPAEADHIAPYIDDREHETVAEAVIDITFLIFQRQTGVDQFIFGIPFFRHGIQ